MPATEIITIINNSGKVISTGKHLVNIFKEAQAAYRDRKEAVKAERAGIRRAQTFDATPHRDPYYDDYYHGRYGDEVDYAYDRRSLRDGYAGRRSYDDGDDGRSHASSRYSRRSRRSHQPRSSSRERGGVALTEANLKTHSEVSATSPSKAYRSPYAETAPRDMQLSRPTLAIAAPPPPSESFHPPQASGALVPALAPERRELVHRPRSDPSLTKKKSIDMNLAYGDVPPDLASRVDLDPAHHYPTDRAASDSTPEDPQEAQALGLMDRIEDFLEEAHCVHHTASSMIENLQRNPEAAAAVALSLAELSALLGKMSPAFLAFLKGGSPAVFALLASPQFLIGAGVAAGVTIVMFGGWKIVKRIKDTAMQTKMLEAPFEMRSLPQPAAPPTVVPEEKALPPATAGGPNGGSATSYDEALVLRDVEELSSIESWRRGIVPGGDDASADIELMSREAERALREQYRSTVCDGADDEVDPSDSVSQVQSVRSYRSRRSHRSHRSSASRRYREYYEAEEERRSSSGRKEKEKDKDGAASETAASERSQKSHRSHRSSSRDEGGKSTVSRSSSKHHDREGGSTVSKSSSKHSSRIGLKAIEEGGEKEENGGDGESGVSKPREKKRDMIKQLFKMKKDREDRERAVSVLI